MGTGATKDDVQRVLDRLVEYDCRGELTVGVERTIITVVGPKPPALQEDVRVLPEVDNVVLLSKSYELAGRESKSESSVVSISDDVSVGGDALAIIAGPGTVESATQIETLAAELRQAGANMLMGGTMTPDQSPYAFRGLGEEGLRHLAQAREATGLLVVNEVVNVTQLETVARYADVLEIGAYNMRNFGLLEAAAATAKPIVLRRGLSATIDDWLLSAEHILYAGNDRVILCESGIRTYEATMPSTTDVSAVPMLKRMTHLPVVIDPAHSAGDASLVGPLALAAVAAGVDGLMLTVHDNPDRALADGPQSLTPEQFRVLLASIATLAPVVGRKLATT
jgi:3-deoxy-7-phosphoheptulonate synthase